MATYLVIVVIVIPLLVYVWHANKAGNRPDPFRKIDDRPVIPAVVIDVDMPISSMIVFLFKLALAAIPALILLVLVMALLLGGLAAGLGLFRLPPGL